MKKTVLFSFFLALASIVGCVEKQNKPDNPAVVDPVVVDSVVVQPVANISIDLPETISAEELDSLKKEAASVGELFKKFSYEGLVAQYQRATNLTHDIYAGYFAHNNPAFNSASPNYVYNDGWSAHRWNEFYNSRSAEYKTLARYFKYVDAEANKTSFYITRIYYAFLASTLTDTYGDVPFLPLVRTETLPEKAPYDKQEAVYSAIFAMLEEAVNNLQSGAAAISFEAPNDKCFGGDVEKWWRFANSLRLRLALRISNVAPATARKHGEAAIASGLMRNNDDRMKTMPKFAPVAMGGDDDGGNENEVANCSFRYRDAVMSKDVELFYKNTSAELDPRCPVSWYRPTPYDELEMGEELPFEDYNGCEIGSHDVSQGTDIFSVLKVNHHEPKVLRDDPWFGYTREFIWFGYAECLFLQAEAALRGWAGAGDAKTLFEEGIKASMNYYNLPADKAVSYISGLKIVFDANDKEAALEQIITQKWMAVFPNGNEGWAEFRRTDYPRLKNILNPLDANIANGKFIKRVSYPGSERDYNRDNVPNVHQGDRVWWDVADTNNANGERLKANNFR